MSETFDVEIGSVAHGGHGVCRIEGQVCFVTSALPGDHARVKITKRTKGVLWGEIDELLGLSPHRQEAPEPHFGACGGCAWLHFAYPAQAEWKRRIVADCLARIGGVEADVGWAEDPSSRTGYRTRAQFHGEGGVWGFYAAGSRRVVDAGPCPLCHERLNEARVRLAGIASRDTIELVVNPEGSDILVCAKGRMRGLEERFPNAIMEKGRVGFLFDGVPIVNGSFSQSSLLLNRTLVGAVHGAVGEADTLLDLYCGAGNLSLTLEGPAEILGLDHDAAATRAANAIGRGKYRTGDEREFAKALGSRAWDVVLLDPPRTGAKSLARDLTGCRTQRIVYVSCDPATLARDTKALGAGGWRVSSVTAVDLFPNTPHIEAVCRFER